MRFDLFLIKLIVVISTFLLVSTLHAEIIKLTIAYESYEQPPYYMGDTTEIPKENPGVAVEMVKLLEDKIDGIEIKFVRYPWKRCLFSLKKNTVDGIFNASYKIDRLEIGHYPTIDRTHNGSPDKSKRITNISYYLYKLKDRKINWDGNEFINFNGTIGAPSGYSIVSELKKKGAKIEETNNSINNLKKLMAGRVDAVALQDVTADNIIAMNPKKFNGVEKVQPRLVEKPYYLMLSKQFIEKNPKLAQKIWNTLKIIRKTKFDIIAKKYSTE